MRALAIRPARRKATAVSGPVALKTENLLAVWHARPHLATLSASGTEHRWPCGTQGQNFVGLECLKDRTVRWPRGRRCFGERPANQPAPSTSPPAPGRWDIRGKLGMIVPGGLRFYSGLSSMAISWVTVAQLRAVPAAWALERDSWAASSLRPRPPGVCRNS